MRKRERTSQKFEAAKLKAIDNYKIRGHENKLIYSNHLQMWG